MEEEREELLDAAEETAEDAAEAAAEAEETEDCETESGDGEITLVGWLWRMCIPLIPCAGIIIYIVLLCMWAFGGKQTETMRVWAKAALIATIIKILFVGVIVLVIQLNVDIFGLFRTLFKKIF